MKKNLKQLMLFGILGLGLISTATFAETKSDCFGIADSEAGFGGAVIISYQCFENEIDIPSTIDGKPVTEIGKGAFKNTVLTTVKLPDTLKQISESAFEDNIIEKIEIPEGVEIIDNYAFKNNKLKALKLPKTLKSIGDEAFYKNNLSKIAVPGRLNKVGENAFCENEGDQVVGVSNNLEWTFKNTCFKLIKASTVENSYVGIETDFTTEINEKLGSGIRTDSPEVDELTSILEELQNDNESSDNEFTGLSQEDIDILNQLGDELLSELTGDEADEKSEIEVIGDIDSDSEGDTTIGGLSIDSIGGDFLDGLSLGGLGAMIGGFFGIFGLIAFLCWLYQPLLYISLWEIYRKAGKRGWAYLIPIYNTVVLAEIAEDSKWWGLFPWLSPLIYIGLSFADLGMMVPIIAAATIGLINLLLYIDWNYKVARRYGWNVFCSVLHVLFAPLTTLFLGLGNYTYQPKKASYDLNKPQVNEPEKSTPAPVVASEQLNNVVEHFVGPEEVENQAPVAETTESPVAEFITEEVPAETQEVQSEEVKDESANLLQEEVEEHSTDAFDNWSSFADNEPVKKEDYVNTVAPVAGVSEGNTEVEQTTNNNSEIVEEVPQDEVSEDSEAESFNTSDEIEDNSIQLNIGEDTMDLDSDSEAPIGEISVQEENEISLDDPEEQEAPAEETVAEEPTAEESVEENTETILPSFDAQEVDDEIKAAELNEEIETSEENYEKAELEYAEETQNDNIEEEFIPNEEPEQYEEPQVEESQTSEEQAEGTATEETTEEDNQPEEETQDMGIDTSFMEDMPQDVVEELNKNIQEIENTEETPAEEVDETQYPDEPISDLDQLMANNNKSL